MLRFNSQHWLFEYERAYSWKELNLMMQLAANPPIYGPEDLVFDSNSEEAKLYEPDPLGLKGRLLKEEKKW